MAGKPGFSPTSKWEQEDYMDCQQSAIVHAAYNYGSCSTWQIVIDFDEYPHSRTDSKPGFITRVRALNQAPITVATGIHLAIHPLR